MHNNGWTKSSKMEGLLSWSSLSLMLMVYLFIIYFRCMHASEAHACCVVSDIIIVSVSHLKIWPSQVKSAKRSEVRQASQQSVLVSQQQLQ